MPAEIKPYIKAFKDRYQEKNKLDEKFDKMDKSSEKETGKALQKMENKDKEIGKLIQNIQNSRETYPDIYEKYLGSSYFDFNFILDNIYIDNFGRIKPIESNANIYSNFEKIYANLPKGRYFGQFAMEQVYQNNSINMSDDTQFAICLNHGDSPVKGRVLSIAYAYEKSKAMPYQKVVNVETYEPFKTDILKNISKSDISLFKLNGDNSPFNAKCYFLTSKDDMHTTDYFKYIIMIKNSKAAERVWKTLIE